MVDVANSYDFNEKVSMTDDYVYQQHSQASAVKSKTIDFMNDEEALNLVKLRYDGESGRGCEAILFELANPTGIAFETGEKHDLLMQLQNFDSNKYYSLRCSNNPRFFEYQGKVYYETKSKRWPPDNTYDEYHRVTTISQNQVREVCDFKLKNTIQFQLDSE